MAHRGPIGIRALTTALLMTPLSRSVEYIRYANETHFDCPGATSTDTCTLVCDVPIEGPGAYNEFTFNCGNAAQCNMRCTHYKCAARATVSATTTANLVVESEAKQCFQDAVVNLPSSGDASFSMTEQKSFDGTTINAGSNTQNIYIDCTQGSMDECKEIMVNAETAQFVQITVGVDSEINGDEGKDVAAEVHCPRNSLYAGPKPAACIFNISQGGTMDYVHIYTSLGIPQDVWVDVGTGTFQGNVQILCDAVSSSGNGGPSPFTSAGICWNTLSPTTDPSVQPTRNPTNTPTAPSASPSAAPTKHPTTAQPSPSPTSDPTRDPTRVPSKNPTKDPTTDPTADPTGNPTGNPTTEPTADPTSDPTSDPTTVSTTDSTEDSDGLDASQDASSNFTNILLIIANVLVCCTFMVCALLVLRRWRSYRSSEKDSSQIVVSIKSSSLSPSPRAEVALSPSALSTDTIATRGAASQIRVVVEDEDGDAGGEARRDTVTTMDSDEDAGERQLSQAVYAGQENSAAPPKVRAALHQKSDQQGIMVAYSRAQMAIQRNPMAHNQRLGEDQDEDGEDLFVMPVAEETTTTATDTVTGNGKATAYTAQEEDELMRERGTTDVSCGGMVIPTKKN